MFTCSTVAESELAGVDAEVVKEGVERLEQAALASMLLALQSQGALAEPDRRYSSSDIFRSLKWHRVTNLSSGAGCTFCKTKTT